MIRIYTNLHELFSNKILHEHELVCTKYKYDYQIHMRKML